MDYIKVKKGVKSTWTKCIPLPSNIEIDSVELPPIKYNGKPISTIKQSVNQDCIMLNMTRPEILKWQYDYKVIISYITKEGISVHNQRIHSDSFIVIHG